MKKWFKKHRGYIHLLIGFGLFRTAGEDWNPIPSGSMWPNLREGDVVLVDRLAYPPAVGVKREGGRQG
jgi:signal peptidase I